MKSHLQDCCANYRFALAVASLSIPCAGVSAAGFGSVIISNEPFQWLIPGKVADSDFAKINAIADRRHVTAFGCLDFAINTDGVLMEPQ